MIPGDYLAVDWGTTNRRVYLIDASGAVRATERDGRGLLALGKEDFASEAAAIRSRFGDYPMICAGMVGSRNGWVEASYRPCPAGLDDLADYVIWVEPGRTAIVPGVSFMGDGHADVMRGEEVQFLGAVAAHSAPSDALLCQPGTHSKWAWMSAGEIASFRTALTGEMFTILAKHSLLADCMTTHSFDGAAFRAGLEQAARRSLLRDLFGARAALLTGTRNPSEIADYVSGLLIGSDVVEQDIGKMAPVYVLADHRLGGLYCAAIAAVGGQGILLDSHDAFVAGITRLWKRLG